MQISIDKNEGLERNLTVSIPAEDIKSKVADKLKEISKQVKIKGFRPGRVPNNVLNNKFGKHARQEVLGEMMNSIIQDAVKEH
ncbi:MAG TPA: trigger factor family protein, partial [Gammaproteobacteria bacterium]|nr:trigger factor family protein [Gammaproteobacteria bacterium]